MGAVEEVLEHLILYGPARNEHEAEALLAKIRPPAPADEPAKAADEPATEEGQ